ncbi:MAG: hypothetical protein ISS35_01090 [Kiritimatiellae bacterium]|nr:hypothetical protein [Kiritimatiellia bacterium]
MAFAGDKKVGTWVLARYEERLKAWLIPKVPSGVETYHLTLSTVLWCLFILLFSFLARYDLRWMWLTSLMIVAQYITDLLDGAIGRHRDTGLVKWGYYMDHFLDYMFLCSILIGYSFLVRDYNKYMLFFVLALFGGFMVNSFLSFAATNEFKISYLGVGPTEVRLVFIAVNTILILSRDYTLAEKAMPYVLVGSAFGLFVTIYRTQQEMWELDMRVKYGDRPKDESVRIQWALGVSGWRLFRNMTLSLSLAGAALAVLMLRAFSPYHRVTALAVYASSWVPLALAFRNKSDVLRLQGRQLKKRVRPYLVHIVLALILLAVARVGYVLAPTGVEGHLASVSARDIGAELTVDEGSYRVLRSAMQSQLAWVQSQGPLQRAVTELTPEERTQVRSVWREFVETFRELQLLRDRYRGFYQIDYLAESEVHARAFALAYAAFVTQYRSALVFSELAEQGSFVVPFLDEADAATGMAADGYSTMKARLTHPDELLRLNAGWVYLKLVDRHLGDSQLVTAIEEDAAAAYVALDCQPSLFVENPIAIFEKRAFKAWFPLQMSVARQMSLTRAIDRSNFVSPGQIAGYRDRLQPGDIILERRNWYMSNIGIPGFWPHVALYVGTAAQIKERFSGLPELEGREPIAVLREAHPEVVEAFLARDTEGYEHCILEALRPGVVFTSLEVSGNADYLAVLRPRRSRLQKWQALSAAFSHHAKPYDYNFSFITDNALVCSELVCKSYQAGGGLAMKPHVVNGRPVVAPNQFAEQFAAEQAGDQRVFDFVLFLEGSEATQQAVERDSKAFAQTWQRPKWDIAQK